MKLFEQKAFQRFLQSTSGKIGLGLTIAIVLMALLAPILRPYDRRFALSRKS